jgi:hypothetical protein
MDLVTQQTPFKDTVPVALSLLISVLMIDVAVTYFLLGR